VLPAPGCDACCGESGGVLSVTIISTDSNTPANNTYRPALVIDQSSQTLTATITTPNTLSNITTQVTVGVEAEAWPQCVLYNKYGLPAVPFIITVPLGSGPATLPGSSSSTGGSPGVNEASSGTSSAVIAVVVILVLVLAGVGAWLAVRYAKNRRANSGLEANAYRSVDSGRTGLLNQPDDSSTGNY